MAEETGRAETTRRVLNQVLGLAVFAAGIVLMALVFLWAYGFYQSLDSTTFGAQTQTQAVQVTGAPAPSPSAPGTVKAVPGKSPPLLPLLLTLLLRLVALLVLGWLAAMIASKGIALAHQPPRQE